MSVALLKNFQLFSKNRRNVCSRSQAFSMLLTTVSSMEHLCVFPGGLGVFLKFSGTFSFACAFFPCQCRYISDVSCKFFKVKYFLDVIRHLRKIIGTLRYFMRFKFFFERHLYHSHVIQSFSGIILKTKIKHFLVDYYMHLKSKENFSMYRWDYSWSKFDFLVFLSFSFLSFCYRFLFRDNASSIFFLIFKLLAFFEPFSYFLVAFSLGIVHSCTRILIWNKTDRQNIKYNAYYIIGNLNCYFSPLELKSDPVLILFKNLQQLIFIIYFKNWLKSHSPYKAEVAF